MYITIKYVVNGSVVQVSQQRVSYKNQIKQPDKSDGISE